MAYRGSEFSFFKDIRITNGWHLHFHNTYGHQSWTAGTSRKVDSLGTNQITTVDVIT